MNSLKEKIRLLEELNGKQAELIKNIERQRECYGLEYATLFGNANKLRESIATLTEQINADHIADVGKMVDATDVKDCRDCRWHPIVDDTPGICSTCKGDHSNFEKPEPVSNPGTGKHELEKGDEYVEFWKELFDDLYMTDHHIAEVSIAFARGMMAGKQEALQSNAPVKSGIDIKALKKHLNETPLDQLQKEWNEMDSSKGNTQQKEQPRISIDTIWETVLYWVSDPAIVLNNEKRSKEYLNALLEEYANQFRSQVTTRDLQEIDRAREERREP